MRATIAAVAGLLLFAAGTGVCEKRPEGFARADGGSRSEDRGPKAGEKAPPIALEKLFQAPEGASADWASLKGKTVVLEFWSTGCGPCLGAIPHMNDLAEELKDKPVQFIAITRNDAKSIEHFIAKRKMAAWVGIDRDNATFEAYGVRRIPTTVLVDASGTVAAVTHPSQLGAEDIEKIIEGKVPVAPDPREKQCDLRKGTCGEEGVKVTLEKCADPQKRIRFSAGPGRIEISNMKPEHLIPQVYRCIYDIPGDRMVVTKDIPKDARYDLSAKAPSRDDAALTEPLKAAIEKEFGLESRFVTKETDVYVLTAVPGGKATRSVSDSSNDHGIAHVDQRQIVLIHRPIKDLAARLERHLKRPVLDETGIEEKQDLVAEWKGEGIEPMTKALKDDLGLILSPERRPVEILEVRNAKAKGAK